MANAMQRRALSVLFAAALCSAASAQPNLVFNGGFETGNFAGWVVPPNVPPPNGNPAFFAVGGAGAHSGNHYAILSSTQLQFISQVLPTVAGTDYALSFWLRRPANVPGTFVVRWEGETVFQRTLFGNDALVWQEFSVPLHGDITGSFLEFGQHYFPGAFYIDDISVVQVPAPSAAALIGVAGLAAISRRRRGG